VGSVWAGLAAAANFAEIFGNSARAERIAKRPRRSRKLRSPTCTTKRTGDSCGPSFTTGTLAAGPHIGQQHVRVFLFGMFPADDPRVVRTMENYRGVALVQVRHWRSGPLPKRLFITAFRKIQLHPRQSLFLCTLCLRNGRSPCQEPEGPETHSWLLEWVMKYASRSGVLGGTGPSFIPETPSRFLPSPGLTYLCHHSMQVGRGFQQNER